MGWILNLGFHWDPGFMNQDERLADCFMTKQIDNLVSSLVENIELCALAVVC